MDLYGTERVNESRLAQLQCCLTPQTWGKCMFFVPVVICYLNLFLYSVSISWFCFVVILSPQRGETTIKVFKLISDSVSFFKDLVLFFFYYRSKLKTAI